MKHFSLKSLLWLILPAILAWFAWVMPALADGAGWPTATPSPTLIRLVTSTSPFGGAVTPVIAITQVGKDQQPVQAGDQALLPTMFSGTAQETTERSNSLVIVGVLGLIITAVLLFILLMGVFRRGD